MGAREDWKGFSGASVFAGKHLVGVVTEASVKYEELKARRIRNALKVPSFRKLVNPAEPTTSPPQEERYNLSKLVCLIDRQFQERVLVPELSRVVAGAHRPPLACIVSGADIHAHEELALRFGFETLPKLLRCESSSTLVRALDWPQRVDDVGQAVTGLQTGLQLLLNFSLQDMSNAPTGRAKDMSHAALDIWRNKLDQPTAPSILYSELPASSFDAGQRGLFEEWLDFLTAIAATGLYQARIHVIALCWDAAAEAPPNPAPAIAEIRQWTAQLQLDARRSVRVLRLPELERCSWQHLTEWLDASLLRFRPDLLRRRDWIEDQLSQRLSGPRSFALGEFRAKLVELSASMIAEP